jgi:hypothetical protein
MKTQKIRKLSGRTAWLSLLSGIVLCSLGSVRAQSLPQCTDQVLSPPTEDSVRVRLTGVDQWPVNPICVWSASGVRMDGASYRWRAVFSGDGLVDGPSVNATVVFLYEINGSIAKSLVRSFLFPYPSGPFNVVVNESDPDTSEGYPAMAVQGGIALDAANNLTVDITFTGGAVVGPDISDLVDLLNGSDLSSRQKRPLLATLRAASSSLAGGDCEMAISQLEAFQNKVRAQLQRSEPALANELITTAQLIVDSACL